MPISGKRFTEYRFEISNLLQRGDWNELLHLCNTSDSEQQKTIASVFSMFDPRTVWKFVSFVYGLSAAKRRQNRAAVATVCYVLGKMGQTNTSKALSCIRLFLSDDHMLRVGTAASLSNLWVLDTKTAQKTLFNFWILKSPDNDDLQEIAVQSAEHLASQLPDLVKGFLLRASRLQSKNPRYGPATRAASNLISQYLPREANKRVIRSKQLRKKPRRM